MLGWRLLLRRIRPAANLPRSDTGNNSSVIEQPASENRPTQLFSVFVPEELGLIRDGEIGTFRVLPGEDGTTDGELSGGDACIWFEAKIASATLAETQVRQHLVGAHLWKGLLRRPEKLRRLVLLTPDDSGSSYPKRFLAIDPAHVLHLEWKRVYAFLARFVDQSPPSTFSAIVDQSCRTIHDMAGVLLKIQFGDTSEVHADRYLEEMRSGEWSHWNTPRKFAQLDGTGRKLLLYDKTRKSITAEVEIKTVVKTGEEFGWSNQFAEGRLHVLDDPVPLSEIEKLHGFEKFGSGRRSPYRNLTHTQYSAMLGHRSR